ncbi:MAG: tagaturonate reductase, partial [Defluviitaleaceae bacterium]|nr:tagaturonate reductase [Defluviitaleaceae bacterium]
FAAELGYTDNLLDTGEIFHFWVIEAPKNIELEKLAAELPFDKIGLNVVWTHDCTPYKARKVRILNGAHTMSVLAAYLCGKDTVGEMMKDEDFQKYLEIGLFDEVIPTITKYLPEDNLKSFAHSVFDRFSNPTISHNLLSIALNSQSKYRARVLPSILDYATENKELPKILIFSFAALIAFYRAKKNENGIFVGTRDNASHEVYEIQDDMPVLEFFADIWNKHGNDLSKLVASVCANEDFWGQDLNQIPGFAEEVTKHMVNILNNNMNTALKSLF